ncbi:MAG: pantoate--beta-alanine ligase [Acidimicrobiia bacterium]
MLGIPESLADDEAPGPVVIVETIAALRAACSAARGTGASIGLVPTMGYLHEGHRTLMRAARAQHDLVVLTIFVNPLQFAPSEDLATYPRDLARDLEAATAEGVDIVFTPSVSEMYPEPTLTTVHVDQLTEGLCGAERPSHFDGVTTVVTKLFSIVGPCTAYFGRKDAQQLAVVTRMARDLNLPVSVVGCPLVREADGLAMSSRNAHLTPEQRANAVVLSRSLEHAAAAITSGVRRAADVRAAIQGVVETVPAAEIEYIEVRDAETLLEVTAVEGRVLVAVAARVGATRLIDNMTVTVDGPNVDCDLGVRTGA